MFKIVKRSKISQARLGLIETQHGRLATPLFMPDATRGQIKNLSRDDLIDLDLKCFVVNALHLFLRPGLKIIKAAGGLHRFAGWRRPILSDSGGYQIFSLIRKNKSGGRGGKITERGAVFKSPLDGAELKLTPEQSIKAQFDLGADIMVCLDDCPPNEYGDDKLEAAVKRTIGWAKRCRLKYQKETENRKLKIKNYKRPLLFAVIQGGNNLALRELCAKELLKIGFDGFGFGARHIDAAGNFLNQALKRAVLDIPENKLRFGLGIGSPADIIRSIKMGYDMFDCVIPTREGRHGKLFFQKSNFQFSIFRPKADQPRAGNFQKKYQNFYNTVNITNAKFAKDFSPINKNSRLAELRQYSKSYLRYLFKINEPLALRLASLNNLEFYFKMLSDVRELIKKNMF